VASERKDFIIYLYIENTKTTVGKMKTSLTLSVVHYEDYIDTQPGHTVKKTVNASRLQVPSTNVTYSYSW